MRITLGLLNPRRRLLRWPLKWALLFTVALFTFYPNPLLLLRHAEHWSDLGALIQPDEPAIAPLVVLANERLEADETAAANPRRALRLVEEVVYEAVPYAWDWETWGCSDYLPTAAETIERGREDCDGRAVVAASILVKLGYEARLVTDGSHMWVWTNAGETMSPMTTASGRTLVSTTARGTEVDLLALVGLKAMLIDWPKNLAYGAAVFPVLRVALLAGVLVLCFLPGRASLLNLLGGAAFAAAAIFTWKWCCVDPWQNSLSGAWTGIGLGLMALGAACNHWGATGPKHAGASGEAPGDDRGDEPLLARGRI